jgi:3-dehydroquinate dehydratase-1
VNELPLLGSIAIGGLPRVVGTIVTSSGLDHISRQSSLPCDVVELRLDHLLECSNWMELSKGIERNGYPVFVTLRSHLEGGKWGGPDQERLPFIERALDSLSGIDVELNSSIANEAAAAARKEGKPCIVSFHDFEKTPSLPELNEIISRGQKIAPIVKISAMATEQEDINRLRELLEKAHECLLCVIAMGSLGTATRISFSAAGSCLTYGYLDKPGAPGQLSARDLVKGLINRVPAYATEWSGKNLQ